MKAFKILILFTFVIFSGFSKDSKNNDNVTVNKANESGVTVPIKVWGSTIHNTLDEITCDPCAFGIKHKKSGFVLGHQTHGGRLIREASPYEFTDCWTVGLTNYSIIIGTNTVANRDSYNYTALMTVPDIRSNNITMEIDIICGTGRFEGATGHVSCTGIHVEEGIIFSGEGYITFNK